MVAVDPVEFKRAKALKFGATHAVATSEETHAPVTDLTSWMRIFPGTVQPEDTVSEELRALPLPQGPVHTLQRELLAKYHVDEPREFFTTNAFWSVPSDPTVEENLDQRPFHVLVGDQHSAEPSFQLASAMVGFNREFPSAYISAHSDPDSYGTITVLRLPTDTLTQGPQTDPELDDLRHPSHLRAHPPRAVEQNPVRQPAELADRRRRSDVPRTPLHRTDLL